ncbi:MAG: hypothetical protein IPP73_04185 [Chitinophagaceae bacterium]|nr:hypothetical protein [Chitinophagaceae bacterium]
MKRKCKILAKSSDGRRAICIDEENEETILAYINQSPRHLKKFRHIIQLILNGHKNADLYDKENYDTKSKKVTAMKFFKGQENDRIYCIEQNLNGTHGVVVVEIYLKKKSQKITKKEIPILHKLSYYEYEIK